MSAGDLSILQLRSSAGLYGADRMVLTLNRELNRMALGAVDVRSRLLSVNNYRMVRQPVHEAALEAGQPTALLRCRGRLDHGTVRALANAIKSEQVQLLHVHDYKSAFYAWLASRIQPVNLVATLHGQVGTSRSLRFYNRLELTLLRRFDALVAVAEEQVATLCGAGISASRIHRIDNGIELPDLSDSEADASQAQLRAEIGLDGKTFVFAAVGRLSPEKNISMLLDAFAPISGAGHATLLLIGDGPEREALEVQIRQLGIGNHVRMLGERHDMHRVYPAVDCLVLPSLTEGMPLVVLEAMAHGLPVLASRVGEVPRLLAHATHARLIPIADIAELQAGLNAMLNGPRKQDTSARDYVFAQHSPEAMSARYLHLYQSLGERRNARQSA